MTKNVPPPPDSAHESSSLFSLSRLEEMASGAQSPASEVARAEPARAARPSPTDDEGSGLLDIHAISAAATAHGNRVVPRPTPMPALLTAPNLPARQGMPMRVKAALSLMGVTIFALGGATLYLAQRQAPEAAVQAEPAPELAAPAAAAPAQVVVAAPTTVTREEAPASAPAAQPEPAQPPAPAARPSRIKPAGGAPAVAAPAAASTKPAASSADSSIDALLDGALGPKGGRPAQPTAAAGAATPSRSDVLAAMQKVTAKVKACGGTGMAVVKLTLSGRTGHVTDVSVDGQSNPTVRACITHEVSRAKLAPFTNPSFSVTYPFKL
jgi:hypothetical protein